MAPSEVRSFQEVILRKFDFETSNLELIWGLEIKHLKAHKFVWQECFFYLYFLATSTTNWALIFTGVLFYAYVETHQMRRLVFDNYLLKCPLSFNQEFFQTDTLNCAPIEPHPIISAWKGNPFKK